MGFRVAVVVDVGVAVGVGVGVAVGVGDGVAVGVGDGVAVAIGVGDGVAVAPGVAVGLPFTSFVYAPIHQLTFPSSHMSLQLRTTSSARKLAGE